jgi:uncharacterized protein (TIGR03083 family)
MAADPWPLIHGERTALADDLEKIQDTDWQTPSLCAEWSVRDVFGHIIATAKMTQIKFFVGLARSGFKFNAMTARNVSRETAGTPAEELASFRSLIGATTHPPGPVEAMVGEAIIHSEDIRRPLGIKRDYPMEAVIRVGDFYKNSNLIVGAKSRITGLQLAASDAEWSTGSGPAVHGPMLSLLLAMTGRSAAVQDLSGDGIETLRSRFPASQAVG